MWYEDLAYSRHPRLWSKSEFSYHYNVVELGSRDPDVTKPDVPHKRVITISVIKARVSVSRSR